MTDSATRRRLLRAGGAGVALGLAGCLGRRTGPSGRETDVPSFEPSGAWPMYAGDAANTGRTEEPGPDDPEVAWRFETTDVIFDGVTVADGRVFAGSQDGNLYAVDAEDGTERWRFPVRGGARRTPAVAGGSVFVGGDQGGFYAVDATSGTQRWDALSSVRCSTHPAIADGRVYVGGEDGTVYGLDAATGTVEWSADTGGHAASGPAVVDGTVYAGFEGEPRPGPTDDGGLLAVSIDGGREWRIEPGTVRRPPAVVDGVVYASTPNATHAFDAGDGTERWRYEPAAAGGTPTIAHGRVYVGSHDSYFYALDAETGEQVWEDTPGKWPRYSAVAGQERVYLCSWATRVYALDAETGETDWVRSMANPMSDPAVVDGTVYVAPDTDLVALRDA